MALSHEDPTRRESPQMQGFFIKFRMNAIFHNYENLIFQENAILFLKITGFHKHENKRII